MLPADQSQVSVGEEANSQQLQQQQSSAVSQGVAAAPQVASSDAPETGAVKKGRFWVTKGEDDGATTGAAAILPPTDAHLHAESISEIPPLEKGTEVRKGRFVVTVTKDDNANPEEITGLAETLDNNDPNASVELLPVVIDQQLQDAATNGSPIAVIGARRPRSGSIIRTTQQQGKVQQQGLKQVMQELQRISQQNHKLHRMLKILTEADPSAAPGVSSTGVSQGQGNTSAGLPQTTPALQGTPLAGATPGSSFGGVAISSNTTSNVTGASATTSQSTTNAPLNIASAADTTRIQELVEEMQSRSNSLITEYDRLKSKNHILTKQMKEKKQQLKEAHQVIDTLKARLAQREERIVELERESSNAEH